MLPKYIKSNKFLLTNNIYNTVFKFCGSDNEDSYQENLEKMPPDWIYRQTPVTYTTNSDGYRTAEFSTIDWRNSIVLFGCSNVFGIGVDDAAMLSSQLQQLTGIPVVNMGLGSTSMTYAYYNQLILFEIEPKPFAVVNVWPAPDRMCSFTPDRVINHGSWNLPTENKKNTDTIAKLKDIDCFITNNNVHSHFARLAAKNLWKNTKYYECSYFPHAGKQLNVPVLQRIDKARDCMHPGIKSHELASSHIAQALNL